MSILKRLSWRLSGHSDPTSSENDTLATASLINPAENAERFTLSKSDPLSTVLTRSDGTVAFEIVTPNHVPLFKSDVTTVTRVDAAGARNAIAIIKWHFYEPGRMELVWPDGTVIPLEEFLRGNEVRDAFTQAMPARSPDPAGLARSFKMKESEYAWRWRSDHFELVDTDNILLARDQRTKIGLFLPDSNAARLDVYPAGTDMLDIIVLTYVCVEQWRRQRASNRRDPGAAATVMALK